MAITIKTNHQPRDIIFGYDLTEKEKAEFDYHSNIEECTFFRYRGNVYDLSEFSRIAQPGQKNNPFDMVDFEGNFTGWQGYMSDSFFSGIVIRYTDDYEQVIVGTYFS